MDKTALFHQVYEMYGEALYRFCLLQMKNAADAEDVLQEVFLKRLYMTLQQAQRVRQLHPVS